MGRTGKPGELAAYSVWTFLLVVLFFLPPVFSQTQARQPTEHLRVLVGKSLVINSPEPLVRVSVTNPAVATAISITERQVLIHGLQPGSVTLLLWNEQEQAQSFDLDVQLDVGAARQMLGDVIPGEEIDVQQSGTALVLTGQVGSEAEQQQAEAVAKTYASDVVNLLSIRENRSVVLLHVKVAEVDRSTLNEMGATLFTTGAGNTFATASTQQFGTISGGSSGGGAQTRIEDDSNGPASFSSTVTLSDLMNFFLFRPDINLGAVIRALNQRNLLQILAEPNVLAMNGREASFLAGGEFPFPVVQGGGNVQAVTIQFREFGVRVDFTPQIQDDGMIRLKVVPEVSSLDFANALTIAGFTVPALSTRRAETEVELKNGQSFAIAGLIDNRLRETVQKVPGLGDIPLLGKLFRSHSVDSANTELLVLVTPQLVKAVESSEAPSVPFPGEFLNPEKFDKERQPEGQPKAPGEEP